MNKMEAIVFDFPSIQIDFANALTEIRTTLLQDALSATVASMDVVCIDDELHHYADEKSLKMLAAHGMRGELLFALPCVLQKNPRLLGYYRLLLGYSQKGFYTSATGAGMFKSLEESGRISARQIEALPDLCKALNVCGKYLLEHLDHAALTPSFFDQLTLLTLGPQLRGGANVQRGSSAISQIFDIMLEIVKPAIVTAAPRCIALRNKSDRTVYIQFAADPDIVIREELIPGIFKNAVAIEVKGGQDYSNIHNRIGEAEKSHQKAKKDGYTECWTIVNVDRIDLEKAGKESPTTNKFYRISALMDKTSQEYQDFVLQVLSVVGI